MSASCPHAHRWLRSTLHQWLQQSPHRASCPLTRFIPSRVRHVSTTSAINRGLRAEKNQTPRWSDRGRRRPLRRDEPRKTDFYAIANESQARREREKRERRPRPSHPPRRQLILEAVAPPRARKHGLSGPKFSKHSRREEGLEAYPGAAKAAARTHHNLNEEEKQRARGFGRTSFIEDEDDAAPLESLDVIKRKPSVGLFRKHSATSIRNRASTNTEYSFTSHDPFGEQQPRPNNDDGRQGLPAIATTRADGEGQRKQQEGEYKKGFGRDSFVEEESTEKVDPAKGVREYGSSREQAMPQLDVDGSVDEADVAPSSEGRLAPERPRPASYDILTQKREVIEASGEYSELYRLVRRLQEAESSQSADAERTRKTAAFQLNDLIDSFNAKPAPMGFRRRVLLHLLGPHTTIASAEDKLQDYVWTRGDIKPRRMPKSIVWFHGNGRVDLVLADPEQMRNVQEPNPNRDEGPADAARIPKRNTLFQPGMQEPDEIVAKDSGQQIKTVSKVDDGPASIEEQMAANAEIFDLRTPFRALKAIVQRCRKLILSIQTTQWGKRVTLENEEREHDKVKIDELRQLLDRLNINMIQEGLVQRDDVKKTLTAVLGLPGKLWTKQHPDGKYTRLWFKGDDGRVELMLKRAPISKQRRAIEQDGSVIDETQSTPEQQEQAETEDQIGSASNLFRRKHDPARRKKQDVVYTEKQDIVYYKLKRCKTTIYAIQQAEQDAPTKRRERKDLSKAREAAFKLVSKINKEVREAGMEQRDVLETVKGEVFRGVGKWSSRQQPDGETTMVWMDPDTGELRLVLKGSVKGSTNSKSVTPAEEDQVGSGELELTEKSEPAWKGKSALKREHDIKRHNRGQEAAAAARKSSKSDVADDMPVSVPHTTAASTFVYGVNAVLACLSAKKRQLYHLYLEKADSSDRNRKQIQKLAEEARIAITSHASHALLNRMSNGRPHNGVVLEASQIPAPATNGLEKPDFHKAQIPIQLGSQSAEEIAVNGTPASLPMLKDTWRCPFVLMLDGILDEGNLGNILRTAYFYGVDAVAVSKNTCASINSPIVAKASSGAIEAVQILSLHRPSDFVYQSLKASWRVYGAVAPPIVIPANQSAKYISHSKVASSSPLRDHPCILMLGAEGEGLRDNLKNRADYFVSIEQGGRAGMPGGVLPGIGVDSMNVGSAAGVLIESFMRKPEGAQKVTAQGALGF